MFFKTAHTWQQAATTDLLITPLVDILAVVTMYLTFGFAVAQSASSRPLSDITLPQSTAAAPIPHATKVSLSHAGVRLENQLVLAFEGGQFAAADVDDRRRIVPLYAALQREKLMLLSRSHSQEQLQAEKVGGDVLYVEATRGLPYGLIDRVLRTAAAAGFTRYRMAVTHRE